MRELKVHFRLDVDDGFPPIRVESLNAQEEPNGLARLDNTPFFAEGVALGDVVACTRGDAGQLEFAEVKSRSGNRALSVIFLRADAIEHVYQYLKSEGCYCEHGEFGALEMLAICVGKSVNYDRIVAYLSDNELRGVLSFAELCV